MTRIPGTDLDIRPLVLGANTFGWTADEHDSHTILDAFLGAGGSLVDTADGYSHSVSYTHLTLPTNREV